MVNVSAAMIVRRCKMSKAILVIDMPESCDECPLLLRSYEERCCLPEKRNSFTTKPDWCPLQPAPEEELVWFDDEWGDWERGYNSCLHEIIGSEEE